MRYEILEQIKNQENELYEKYLSRGQLSRLIGNDEIDRDYIKNWREINHILAEMGMSD